MAEFPSTLPYPLVESTGAITKAQTRTKFEGGYVQSRAKHTRARGGPYSLKYSLSQAQFNTLKDFFTANQGGSFTYDKLDEKTGITDGNYRFAGDSMEWAFRGVNRYRVSLELEEV